MAFSFLSAWFVAHFNLCGGKNTLQAVGKLLHRLRRIIDGDFVRVSVAGNFFQHVCGNSDPVSAA